MCYIALSYRISSKKHFVAKCSRFPYLNSFKGRKIDDEHIAPCQYCLNVPKWTKAKRKMKAVRFGYSVSWRDCMQCSQCLCCWQLQHFDIHEFPSMLTQSIIQFDFLWFSHYCAETLATHSQHTSPIFLSFLNALHKMVSTHSTAGMLKINFWFRALRRLCKNSIFGSAVWKLSTIRVKAISSTINSIRLIKAYRMREFFDANAHIHNRIMCAELELWGCVCVRILYMWVMVIKENLTHICIIHILGERKCVHVQSICDLYHACTNRFSTGIIIARKPKFTSLYLSGFISDFFSYSFYVYVLLKLQNQFRIIIFLMDENKERPLPVSPPFRPTADKATAHPHTQSYTTDKN